MRLCYSRKDPQHSVRISNVDNKKHVGMRRLSLYCTWSALAQIPGNKCKVLETLLLPHSSAQNRLHSVRRPYLQKTARIEPFARSFEGRPILFDANSLAEDP